MVGDANWGFIFNAPDAWNLRTNPGGALLSGKNTAGLIFVLPHRAANGVQMQRDMQMGLREGQTQLLLKGKLARLGNNLLWGNYSGTYQGRQVQARCFGALLQGGGGAYVFALASPGAFSDALSKAAAGIAHSVSRGQAGQPAPQAQAPRNHGGTARSQPGGQVYQPAQPAPQPGGRFNNQLLTHFAGSWRSTTKNTETVAMLNANGTFAIRYSASYSGQYSGNGGSWGHARDDNSQGRWAVQGNKRRGTLFLQYNNGEVDQIPYAVQEQRGRVYWREYWFNRQLWYKFR